VVEEVVVVKTIKAVQNQVEVVVVVVMRIYKLHFQKLHIMLQLEMEDLEVILIMPVQQEVQQIYILV
jgi:hypothetical protein